MTEASIVLADRSIVKTSAHMSQEISHDDDDGAGLDKATQSLRERVVRATQNQLYAAVVQLGRDPDDLAGFRNACASRMRVARARRDAVVSVEAAVAAVAAVEKTEMPK